MKVLPMSKTAEWLAREELLLGAEAIAKFADAHVLVVGLGGVGSWAAEFLARAGIGHMTIVDGDVVDTTNRNRQLPALVSTIGRSKVEVMAERLKDINPGIEISALHEFLRDERLNDVLGMGFDFVVDAIDSLSQKVYLLAYCRRNGIRVVSSMGSGGKLDPTRLRIADIEDSNHCRLAKMVRKRLHRLEIRGGIPVVYSSEELHGRILELQDPEGNARTVVGTISYLPAAFGAACASVVLRFLSGTQP